MPAGREVSAVVLDRHGVRGAVPDELDDGVTDSGISHHNSGERSEPHLPHPALANPEFELGARADRAMR